MASTVKLAHVTLISKEHGLQTAELPVLSNETLEDVSRWVRQSGVKSCLNFSYRVVEATISRE